MFVGFVGVAQLAGLFGSLFTDTDAGSWYDRLDQPAFAPPGWVFAVVWTVLYLAIGLAAWLVWRHDRDPRRRNALTWWGLQLLLNAAWPPLFFGAHAPRAALIEIVALVIAVFITMRQFLAIDRFAGWLFAPYLGWVLFATLLNGAFVVMN